MLAPGFFAAKGLAKLEAMGEADFLTIAVTVGGGLAVAGFIGWRIMVARLRAQRLAAGQLCPAE
jgi:hypothetical protein